MATAAQATWNHPVKMYESVDMASSHIGGRTEVFRIFSVTSVKEFINSALTKQNEKPQSLQELLKTAIPEVRSYVRGLKGMNGFERLFRELKTRWSTASEGEWPLAGTEIDTFLGQPDLISTSRLDGPKIAYFTFRTVDDHGLGIAYVVNDDAVTFLINYHKDQERYYGAFIKALIDALDQQKRIINGTS